MRAVVLFLFLKLSFVLTFAQSFEPCATNEYIDYLETQNPGIKKHMDDMYMQTVQQVKKNDLTHKHGKINPIDTTFVIKLVFHVVYRTADQNIADSLIQEQVEVLNSCFNRHNADTINTRDIFKPVAGSARIRFELATVDPDGNPTSGITRRQTTVTTFNTLNRASRYDYVKESIRGGVDAWDTDKYINVWVCNLDATNGQLSLLGYAFPPTGASFWLNTNSFATKNKQGVVLHYETVGTHNPANLNRTLYTNEKTAVHEFGHYFGLRHIWGDGGCAVDDYLDDTPLAIAASRGCPIGANTCTNDELPDQVENYMDYGSAECSNMFTKQQLAAVRHNLMNLRTDLGQPEVEYEPIPQRAEFNLFPNPSAGQLEFFSEDILNTNVTLVLTNYLGQVVSETTRFKDNYILNFDNLDVANGYYRATVQYDGKEIVYEDPIIILKD